MGDNVKMYTQDELDAALADAEEQLVKEREEHIRSL